MFWTGCFVFEVPIISKISKFLRAELWSIFTHHYRRWSKKQILMLGQYTCARALLHFSIPIWPSWIFCRIIFLMLDGTTMHAPFNTNPSAIVSCSQTLKCDATFGLQFAFAVIQLCRIKFAKLFRSGSFVVSSRISLKQRSDTDIDDMTIFT